MRTARATSPASQSLETKPDAPAARAAVGGDPARARDEQHARDRRRGAQALADLRAGLRAEEQVHERDLRRVAAGELLGLVARARDRKRSPTAARRA